MQLHVEKTSTGRQALVQVLGLCTKNEAVLLRFWGMEHLLSGALGKVKLLLLLVNYTFY